MSDVVRHGAGARSTRRSSRGLRTRLSGLVLYVAIVGWCAYALPDTLPFVVPGAVLGGGVLHVLKARPWLGLAVFTLIVVVLPVFVWPAMLTGSYSDLTDWF